MKLTKRATIIFHKKAEKLFKKQSKKYVPPK